MTRTQPLTRDEVLRTALVLADETGIEALSMRKLAKEVGVEAMSLYHHVANKEDLIDGLVDLVFAEIDEPSGAWRAAMEKRAAQTRAALQRHPWAVGLMEARAVPGPFNRRLHEGMLRVLREAGFSVAMTARAYSIQDSFLYGFCLQERALPDFDDPAVSAAVAVRQLSQAEIAEAPYNAEMLTEHIAKGGYSLNAEFAFGLALILDGLEALLAQGAPRP
jgi:AcrR family transcriptional regulator